MKRKMDMKIFKNILNWLCLLVGGKSELTDSAVEAGICDFGGQGRDRYGN